MKNRTLSFLATILIAFTITTVYLLPKTIPQWHLPEDAKSRLGKGRIYEIKYSPDGTKLAVASGIGVWIYDAQSGEELDLLLGHTRSVYTVAFSPDGTTLASGSGDDTIRLWNTHTGTHIRTLTGHTGFGQERCFQS